MTVSTTTNKVRINGNGITTSFPFQFPILKNDFSDLKVYRIDIDEETQEETATLLSITTNYTITVTKNLEQRITSGYINLINENNEPLALTENQALFIMREEEITQDLDLYENQKFPYKNLENMLDKIIVINQQQQEQIDRTLKTSSFFTGSLSETITSPVENRSLKWKKKQDGTFYVSNSDTDVDEVYNQTVNNPNVIAVGQNINNVNISANNINSINAVAPNIASVNSVANNINNVNTLATNITTIQTKANTNLSNLNTILISIATDLNTITTPGNYEFQPAIHTNTPFPAGAQTAFGMFVNINPNNGTILQYVWSYGNDFFYRTYLVATTTWTAWAQVANTNLNNLSAAGKETLDYIAGPSNRFLQLSLEASGTTYTAPSNGWVYLFCEYQSGNAAYVQGFNVLSSLGFYHYFHSNDANIKCRNSIPCKKGDTYMILYNCGLKNIDFKFVYAEGSY